MGENMKLGLVLSATDRFSRVVDRAMGRSLNSMTNFQKRANAIGGNMQRYGVGMMAAGAAITGALAANVNSTMEKAKQIEFTSQKIGLSTEQFQKLNYAASKSNLSVDQFSTGMGKLSKTIVMATAGQKASQKIMRMAGVTTKDSNGHLKDTTQILGEISDKFHKAPDGPKKVALAMLMFGKSGRDMIPMLNKGGKAITELGEKFKKSNSFLTGENIQGFKKYRSAIANTKLQLDGLKTQIAVATLPLAIKLADKISKIADKFGRWIQRNKALFTTIVSTTAVIGGLLTVMGAFNIVSGSVIKFLGTMSKVIAFAKRANLMYELGFKRLIIIEKLQAAWTKITAAGQWLLNAAVAAFPAILIVAGIAAVIAVVVVCWKKFAGFRAVVKTVLDTIKGFGNILKEYVIDRIKGLISGIGSVSKAFALLRQGKFTVAGKVAWSGVKDLSGITATQNAVRKSVVLVKSIPGTYNRHLAIEEAAQRIKDEPKSRAAVRSSQAYNSSTIQRANVSNAPVLNYSPTIHISGGDKTAVDNIFKDHIKELEQMMKKISAAQQRVSFS